MYELSLFTGAGGGLLGTHLLGWTPIGAVEIEEYPCRVLEQRQRDGILPRFPIWQMDIREFNRRVADRYRGVASVISAGFPCQPFSNAGKQEAGDDDRNMWPATIESIRLVRPAFVFLENVPGLLSTGYAFTVIDDLQRTGYQVLPPIIVGADDVGAPHKRERVWIVAYTYEGQRQLHQRSIEGKVQVRHDPDGSGSPIDDVANADSKQHESGASAHKWPPAEIVFADTNGQGRRQMAIQTQNRRRHTNAKWGDWWTVEPGLDRLANGVSHRTHRIRAAGNAQVPAVVRAAWELLTA